MTSKNLTNQAVSPSIAAPPALRLKTSVRAGKATDDKHEPGGENIK